ncbi:FKBP-type peptidyl-prolyl cis-trans isomerase [Leucobacter sp. NPDC058333]|uniref:FKBP-type peptidyl-prolyl cis-trans isomerase n=1 Tax=Leucobacter sp. NPDC058333 TaxID=3346450 RepID=UPI0036621FB3
MKLTRAIAPVALVGALLLAGCSGGGSAKADADGTDCLASGKASSSVKVSGSVGDDLKLTSDTPVSTKKIERSVIKEGKGDVVEAGQSVLTSMTLFSGADGSVLQQLPANAITVDKGGLADWAYEGLRCATAGEQVALAAPYADVFGDQDPKETGLDNITADDSLVIVMEFGEISDAADAAAATGEPGTLEDSELLKKAEGKSVKAPAGFPTVKLADNGEPTITIPKGVDAPTKLSIATLIEGDGETVKPGDRVYVNYRGVIWSTGEEFDSSWSRGAPANFMTTGVIGGFQKALEGQKVGSQVISVVPAEDGGYGAAGLKQQGHKEDDVMVFVLDILGTVHADSAAE